MAEFAHSKSVVVARYRPPIRMPHTRNPWTGRANPPGEPRAPEAANTTARSEAARPEASPYLGFARTRSLIREISELLPVP